MGAMSSWQRICARRDLVANSGVVARLNGVQVALFMVPGEPDDQVFALENRDPRSAANVIGRGLLGHLNGELVVASPLYKQHYRLRDGGCVEYPDQGLRCWPARVNGESVEIDGAEL